MPRHQRDAAQTEVAGRVFEWAPSRLFGELEARLVGPLSRAQVAALFAEHPLTIPDQLPIESSIDPIRQRLEEGEEVLRLLVIAPHHRLAQLSGDDHAGDKGLIG